MSMAVSLEVREPFFDHELVEYVLQVPDDIKYPRYAKSLLVESLAPLIPNEVVFRKKQGFVLPWEIWMRKQLFGFCDRKVKAMAGRDFIDGKELLSLWKQFQKGETDLKWTDLWMFIALEHWMEKTGWN
jgi:asparagine synthase (glutamine-hydrolysing)